MKHALIHIFKKSTCTNIAQYYIDLYLDLLSKYDIEIIITFQKDDTVKLDTEKQKHFQELGLQYFEYQNEDTLKDFLDTRNKINIQVYTYYEELIYLSNELKKYLGQQISQIDGLFTSKNLQRENLLKYDKNITVNFKKYLNATDIISREVIHEFSFPFIIKPSFGISSSGVMKIHNESELEEGINKLNQTIEGLNENRKTKSNEVIIEEYIDGKMYTIDYFVDENGNINTSYIIKTSTLKDEYDIDDFGITSELLGKDIEKEINKEQLNTFLKKCVAACKIKNTFVHHEFKLTSKGQLKTIELNGRIGGYRPEMYKIAYGINLLEMLFNENTKKGFLTNYQFVGFFPKTEKQEIFEGLTPEFIKELKSKKSYFSYMIKKSLIGKQIGFTKNGFKYFGTARLVHQDMNQLKSDYQYIKENLDTNIIYK